MRSAINGLSRKLETDPLGTEELSDSWLSTNERDDLRPSAHEVRQIKNAVRRLGSTCYLIRLPQSTSWKAAINGRIYQGTFGQVLEAITPLIQRHLPHV